jgi:hypothetical protein
MRQGLYAKRLYKKDIKDTSKFTDIIATYIEEQNPSVVFLDMGAMGSPILDNLRRLGYGGVTQGIYFQQAPIRDDLYVNRRAEMWHAIAKWLKDGGTLPKNAPESQDIEDDLTSPEYFYSNKGKMQLESKEDMKERGLPSPDDGDALALTFAAPVRVGAGSSMAIIDD